MRTTRPPRRRLLTMIAFAGYFVPPVELWRCPRLTCTTAQPIQRRFSHAVRRSDSKLTRGLLFPTPPRTWAHMGQAIWRPAEGVGHRAQEKPGTSFRTCDIWLRMTEDRLVKVSIELAQDRQTWGTSIRAGDAGPTRHEYNYVRG